MDNDNINEAELKKQKEQEANTKTAHVAGKAAATYFGGAAGAKLYDAASNTEVGKKIEQAAGSALQQNQLLNKASQKLNDSGALDAADKGLDLASGNQQGLADGGNFSNLNNLQSNNLSSNNLSSNNLSSNSLSSNNPSSNNGLESNNPTAEPTSGNSLFDSVNNKTTGGIASFIPGVNKKITIILPLVSFLFFFLSTIIVASSVMAPAIKAAEFVEGLWDGLIGFLTGTSEAQRLEGEFYKTLKNTQKEYNNKYSVCIDVNLITATLTAYTRFDKFLEEGEKDTDEKPNDSDTPYKQMTKQIKLLANMQMTTSHYELDENGGSYCSGEKKIEPIKSGNKNSSTPEIIAGNDMTGIQAFFTKKVNEEVNNAYYYYYPQYNSDGTCSKDYAKGKLPGNKKEISIGDYATREDSVYYWNLVNSFIPTYYSKYLPENQEQKQSKIIDLADKIYLFYKQIGPSRTCGGNYGGPSVLCSNGITIEGEGTFELEEYVAGVVSNEAYSSEGMEALKAQAIAARNYALMYTNYCTKTIPNDTTAQTFTRNINDNAKTAATSTAGEVLVDKDGNIFAAQYDSFCYEDKDCPDAKKNDDGSFSVTYTKVPNGEKHVITLSDPKYYNWMVYPNAGHAHGMSQLVSYQLAKEGKSYEEILKYFYSDGVSIKKVEPLGGSGGEIIDGTADQKLAFLFPAGIPSSDAEARNYMTTVEFPVVDINGIRNTKRATVHNKISQDFINIMTEIANSGFPIKDVGCYNWRSAAASSSRSHHSYGIACDLNVNENAMYKNGQLIAGKYYKPGEDPYSFPADGVVVKTFARYGWGWGGSWNSSKDYMHFSFTNR